MIGLDLRIHGSPFADADDDTRLVREAEIWLASPSGQLTARVWHASVDADAVVLAEGTFDLGTSLEPWQVYAVRLRDLDTGSCSASSEWSAPSYFHTDDGSVQLFNGSYRPDIHLTISNATRDALNAQAYPPGCVSFEREYYTADAVLDGQQFLGVGVHTKGGCGSSRDLTGKASFKVSLEWDDPTVTGCPASRRWRGQKTLTLNNMVQDTTQVHEVLGYQWLRELGLAAPRATYARLFVNGDYWGLYAVVESIDRRFLERNFTDHGGMLYEGAYWCDLNQDNVPATDVDTTCLTREFRPDACDSDDSGFESKTYEPVRELVSALDALPSGSEFPDLESLIAYEDLLTDWAAQTAIAHWDSYYFTIINNYRVYHDRSDNRWHLIHTGLDQTFAGDVNPLDSGGRLIRVCANKPACRARFLARLSEIADHFEAAQLDVRAAALFEAIRVDLEADPRKERSVNNIAANVGDMQMWIAQRPAQLRAYIANASN